MLNLLKSLDRRQKSRIFLAHDVFLIALALVIAVLVSPNVAMLADPLVVTMTALPTVVLLSGIVLAAVGVPGYQLVDLEGPATGALAFAAILLAVSMLALSYLVGYAMPTQVVILFGTLSFIFPFASRLILYRVVTAIYRRGESVCRVLIYGAGTTGKQLVQALKAHQEIDPVAFVDDNRTIQGLTISGLPVFSPIRIREIVAEKRIDRVLLAIPSLSPPKQAQLSRRLQKMGLEVQMLPSFSQLIGQETLVDKLTTLNPQSLLNRAEIDTPIGEGAESYAGKCVLVSGAGGSIGAELCRQVIEFRPRKLVLFELSEYALFSVELALRNLARDAGVELILVLGSVTDPRQVKHVLNRHAVQVVLHAAAYKHVSLVQQNPLAGMANNVLGTHTLATAAIAAGVERFTLISSDKAVRPKGVMGASKRFAELVVQDLASRVTAGGGPVFSMVRFGNVLGSSGSVIPIFHDQIQRGGPVEVTHPEVTRFFMTIQEAAQLVLKAGAMAEGGEVFLLDMGQPVRIRDLAQQTIEAAGYSVRDEANPDGDIEITFIGLRPGEKLAEELFLDGSEKPTSHRKIFRVREAALSRVEMASTLRDLRHALAAGDEARMLDIVATKLPSFDLTPQPIPVPAPAAAWAQPSGVAASGLDLGTTPPEPSPA